MDAEEVGWIWICGGKKTSLGRVGEIVRFGDGMVTMECDGETMDGGGVGGEG